MAEAVSGVPKGPILFVIYVNDIPNHLLADSLLFADDVQLIAPPPNCHDILQNSLSSSTSWSKDWELDLNPTKSEHLPIGYSPHFVTYTLPSHNLPKPRTFQQSPPLKTLESSYPV